MFSLMFTDKWGDILLKYSPLPLLRSLDGPWKLVFWNGRNKSEKIKLSKMPSVDLKFFYDNS